MSSSNSSTTVLPPNYFEEMRRNAATVRRVNNVDVITTGTDGDTNNNNETYAFCHIPYFFPFSFFPDGTRVPFDARLAYEGAAGIHLALQHLNTGNGVVVKEVEGLDKRCNIRFTTELFDTEQWERTAVNHVIDLLDRDYEDAQSDSKNEWLPCAFLGAGRSAVTMPMSIVTGVQGYAQMSGISTSSQLDDRSQYRSFGRLIPSDDGTAIPIMIYLRDVVQTEHLAVVHTNNPYSNAFLESLNKAGTEYAPNMNIQSIDIPFNLVTDQDIQTAVTFLKNTQFRYIFAIIDGPNHYDRLLTEAYFQGIAGPEFVWMYSDSLLPNTVMGREYEPDSPLAHATRGSSMMVVKPGLVGSETFDSFLEEFHKLNTPEFVEYMQAAHPVYDPPEGDDYVPLQVADVFNAPDPGLHAIFLYDSAIAMGLAACSISSSPDSNDEYFDGDQHFAAIVNTTFTGASGPIVIDPNTGSRDPSSAYFELINFQERRTNDNNASSKVTFEAVQTDLFSNGSWTSLRPYIYGDGTSNMPPPLPAVDVDYNYISPGLRGTGFALSGLVLSLSIAFAIWTIHHRKSKVVCASQPIFLHFITAGVALMGAAIIPLSFDDKIASQRGLDVACMATPWLFIMGFAITFSALFSKTWRINQVFHNPSMRRIKVTALDVMKPLIGLLAVDALVLALWTGLDPLHWDRDVRGVDVFGQTLETRGYCYGSDSTWIPYITVLAVINLGALAVALYQAWRARDIALEFAESVYIGRAIGLFLLACLYGIPVLAMTWEDPSARYFVLMAIFFVCSFSVLLLIFVPKVVFLRRGYFKKASNIVRQHVRSGRQTISTGQDYENGAGSGPFVSGLTRESAASDAESTEEFGVKVIDCPDKRQHLKERNTELQAKQKMLQERVKLLEQYRRKSLANSGGESTAHTESSLSSIGELEEAALMNHTVATIIEQANGDGVLGPSEQPVSLTENSDEEV